MTSSGEGNGTPLQYSCLENPMDGGAWWAAVHGVAEGWTRLSDFTFTFHFHALEKERATHSSLLAWRIPGTGKPGGLPSMGSHRVRHDWSDLAVAAMTSSPKDLDFNRACLEQCWCKSTKVFLKLCQVEQYAFCLYIAITANTLWVWTYGENLANELFILKANRFSTCTNTLTKLLSRKD